MSLKYIDEYRDPELSKRILEAIRRKSRRRVRLMEICGTHTVSIFRSGLREVLPESVELVSGPGCPVCVTAAEDIDRCVWLAEQPGVIVTTFGDLVRVPGSAGSLQEKRAAGADVRMVYAAFDAVEIARWNPDKQVVFLGIGFETTAPTVAAAISQASEQGVPNFSVFSMHKLLPPVMEALLNANADDLRVDGFLCPGHVSVVLGAGGYREIASTYGVPCVIAGFEPLDVLRAIYLLVAQLEAGRAEVENAYGRAVTWEGNGAARNMMMKVFEPAESPWRGLGRIPVSGLRPREVFRGFDAEARFDIPDLVVDEHPGCRCGEVLRGVLTPPECGLYRKVCTPTRPFGPCMVSSEGTCGAYFRYHAAG